MGNRSNTAPLATNIVGNVMTGVTPTRPMMTAHPITETLQYQSTTTTTPTNGTVRENQNHPNTSAKTPNGQRILSLPHSSNGSGEVRPICALLSAFLHKPRSGNPDTHL